MKFNITPLRLLIAILIVFAIIALFSCSEPSSDVSDRSGTRLPNVVEMGESMITLHEYQLTIRLAGGKAEFSYYFDEPDGPKGYLSLGRVIAETSDLGGDADRPHRNIFGVVSVAEPGDDVYSYLLLFEDDGRGLSFQNSATIGKGIVVSRIDIGPGSDDASGEYAVRVVAHDLVQGGGVGVNRTAPKNFIFRVKRSDGSIVRNLEADGTYPQGTLPFGN